MLLVMNNFIKNLLMVKSKDASCSEDKNNNNNNNNRQFIRRRNTAIVAILKTLTHSLDFVINRLSVKLFNTVDIAIVKQCQEQFSFTLPSVALERRRTKFMHKLCCVDLHVTRP